MENTNEWDEVEWDRLLNLAKNSKYNELVETLQNRPLKHVMWIIGLIDRQLGSIKSSNLSDAIYKFSTESLWA